MAWPGPCLGAGASCHNAPDSFVTHGKPNMTEQAAADTQPKFEIQRVYLKDLSLEQPNSPAILFTPAAPQVDIQLALNAEQAVEGFFEVTVTATITAKQADKVLFLVEAKQAGLFEVRNVPQEQMSPLLGITCPHIVYPYLRANVADAIQRAGFPPVQLQEINFQAMFQQQMAQQQQAAQAVTAGGEGGTQPKSKVKT